jgi:oxygen-independent coproporphyrinogen-3 oxidase
VHVPFCNTICYYCACNTVISRNYEHAAKYIRYVEKEIGIVGGLVEGSPPVIQLHWGGGTPTFLQREEMVFLAGILKKHFVWARDCECSIEIDPRAASRDIACLAELDSTASPGIQDFDPAVQKAVNRIQSETETRRHRRGARQRFVSVNVT